MNKSVKRVSCIAMSLLLTAPFIAGCKKDKGADMETRAMVLSIDALDGKFNPYFATSAPDVSVTAQTQISMLSADSEGYPTCGQDEPTVALDYKVTEMNGDHVATAGEEVTSTEYEFVIKNGIKFSDGKPLTVKDVLFNLYVYLDPAYMGSSTIYSTKIQGLNAYRAQDPTLSNDSDLDTENTFETQARARLNNLVEYLAPPKGENPERTEQIEKDIKKARELFREEVESDWINNYSALEGYKEDYRFTQIWEAFYYAEGLVKVTYKTNENGRLVPVKDANGKYITNLDEESNTYSPNSYNAELANVINTAMNDTAKIAEYKTKYNCDDAQAKEYIMRDTAIDTVYNSMVYTDTLTKKEMIAADVINYWATGDNLYQDFIAEARSNYFAGLKENNQGNLLVPYIEGITTYNTKTKAFTGGEMGETLDATGHDVLKIVIDDVDPKAIWNFAFTVSPMHYYGGEYSVQNCNYSVEKGNVADVNFGVKFGDKEFFDNVLQGTAKNGLPVGAGAYMACNMNDTGSVTADNFYTNNWVYYKANPYFETVGTGLNNAHIKYMRYKVISSDKIVSSLVTGEIDYGTPNATPENRTEVGNYKDTLNYKTYMTNGYGYVGINPKFVPDIAIRRAIMMAMNTTMTKTDYYKDLSEVIYRPMSITSWAYPRYDANGNLSATGTPVSSLPNEIKFKSNAADINAYLDGLGRWVDRDGDGVRENRSGEKLKYTFTIAGETKDHPAYAMFVKAEQLLEQCGFEIDITTDVSALRKLATGGLQVWAAAWSSTIDPDMYQVYHKDSTATSVKNWGYPEIFDASNGDKYATEQQIINDLSDLIEEGRATTNVNERMKTYEKALDKVMELAVELPTYQRNDMVVYSKTLFDETTLNQNPSANEGLMDRIWEVKYKA